MKSLLLLLLLFFGLDSLSQTASIAVKETREVNNDASSFAYSLPFEKGKCYLLVQAYQSKLFSHKGEFALDFKMKKGSKICAARGGVVVEIKEDSKKGGVKMKYLSEGNHVIIKHDDGTYGNYWHLKHNGALVTVGDTIQQGQVIGLAGKTGYAAFSHLHFEVTTEFTPGQHQIPTQFETKKGKRYLKPLHWYRCI
jgi:murein DD-endopeptidase MepM/ murein hydrolase activator NlpD